MGRKVRKEAKDHRDTRVLRVGLVVPAVRDRKGHKVLLVLMVRRGFKAFLDLKDFRGF
jgi:hypothetical protein